MKTLIRTRTDIPWMPNPHEARLYLTDELPPAEQCSTAFGFVFQGDEVLLTRLRDRDWDIPCGVIDPGETPEAAAVREVWEETSARVEIVALIGTQELELLGLKPEGHRWPYPISTQVYYLCRLVELAPFAANNEASERRFFAPDAARQVPTMVNHDLIYEAALRAVLDG
jgi:8-oxo-dGTP pyrophosphatase MutT (NUDIX family)